MPRPRQPGGLRGPLAPGGWRRDFCASASPLVGVGVLARVVLVLVALVGIVEVLAGVVLVLVALVDVVHVPGLVAVVFVLVALVDVVQVLASVMLVLVALVNVVDMLLFGCHSATSL